MKISVALRAKFHGFNLAQQLLNRKALSFLYTSFYGNFLGKDNSIGFSIPELHIKTNLISAILTYGIKPKNQLLSYEYFGNWVAKNIQDEDLIITWGLSALPIIEKAKKLKILTVVERGSSHATFQRDILLAENEIWGVTSKDLLRSFSSERMERELLEYKEADFISIPSDFVKRTFIENGIAEEKLIKIPYGVDLTQFYPMKKQDDIFRIIFVGGIRLRKGVQYLLKAFSELKLEKSELWLVGGIMPDIKGVLEKYEGSFKYFSPVPQGDLRNLYSQASLFVICSIEEGMAMVLPQAMACGLPVICTTNSGGEDLIEDGKEGYIIPIRDIDALKERILFLYNNRDLCSEMGNAARLKVQSGLTWDDYGHKIFEKYSNIILKNSQGV
ncbi:MAG: glycosyltransferase family 4 protein [Cytophagaceae bacterium]